MKLVSMAFKGREHSLGIPGFGNRIHAGIALPCGSVVESGWKREIVRFRRHGVCVRTGDSAVKQATGRFTVEECESEDGV